MKTLSVNGINLGFYPDEGDAGGTKSYLSDLNAAISASWPHHHHHHRHDPSADADTAVSAAPIINVVGWYAQTYPGEEFTGFQLMPLIDDIKQEYIRHSSVSSSLSSNSTKPRFIYEASVMPFQSWTGYTAQNNQKAVEIARVMQTMLERSRLHAGTEDCDDAGNDDDDDDDDGMALAEIRLRFGHEMNYYIRSGL